VEANILKGKPLLAVLLGLLMVGVTAGSAEAIKIEGTMPLKASMDLHGIYDPNPNSKVGTTITTHHRLDRITGIFKITSNTANILIWNGKKMISTRKRISIFRSRYFDGYVILFNNSNTDDKILALQGNIYTNGTIEIFLADRNGGVYALNAYDKKLSQSLSAINLPMVELDKNDWLPLVVTPEIKVMRVSSPEIIPMGGTESRVVNSDNIIIVRAQWLEPYEEQWYIKVRCSFEGPTLLRDYGDYKVAIRILDEGKYIDRGTSFVLKSMETPLQLGTFRPDKDSIEVGLTAPWNSAIHDRVYRVSGPVLAPRPSASLEQFILWTLDLLSWAFDIPNPMSLIPDHQSELSNFYIPPGDESNSFKFVYKSVKISRINEYLDTEGIIIEYQSGTGGTSPIYVFYRVPVYWEYPPGSGFVEKLYTINERISLTVTHW